MPQKWVLTVNEFGFASFELSVDDFMKEGNIIQLGYFPLRIDLLTQIDGVTFSECYPNKTTLGMDGISVDFIGYHDLIKNKEASGRYKDDLENLSE